jgi:hypothetical protein
MFLNALVESPDHLFKSVFKEMDVGSVGRVARVNKSFADIIKPYLSERRSIRLILKFWRSYGSVKSSGNLSRLFIGAGLSEAGTRALGWDDVRVNSRRKSTIKIMKLFMIRSFQICAVISPTAVRSFNINCRVLTSAFWIVCFPAMVFSNFGPLEDRVLQSARALVTCLDSITGSLSEGLVFHELPRDLVASFPRLVFNFTQSHADWKTVDVEQLQGRMEFALEQMLGLVAQTPLDDTVSHAEFARHITNIRARYLKMLGQMALDELDLRVGVIDAVEWANDMMAQFMA